MNDFNFYLTSIEPGIEQKAYSQSIGGYCSLSTLYPISRLETEVVGLYDTSFNISSYGDYFNNVKYISINNEIMEVLSFDDGHIEVKKRGHNGVIGIHIEGDDVMPISGFELFNDVFNKENRQYRCIAMKNDGDNILRDIEIFLYQNSRNENSVIRISFEMPKSNYLKSTSTSRSLKEMVDESLVGAYPDDYFSECFLKPEGEIGGIVKRFDSSTGAFLFYDSFSHVLDNKEYEVFPSPSNRLKSGADFSENNLITSFSIFDIDSPFLMENIFLKPNDIIYLWIEREVTNISKSFKDNNFIINVFYEEGQ